MAKGSLVLCDEVVGIFGHVIAARLGQDCLPFFHSFGLFGGKIESSPESSVKAHLLVRRRVARRKPTRCRAAFAEVYGLNRL